jgi:spermidine synthase
MFWFAIFFFFSGLCSLIYELVWLRLAMAKFGVTTALVSIVLSVFMAGLGAGSWAAGWATRRYGHEIKFSITRAYGFLELLIGFSALLVPLELNWGSRLLERVAGHVSISSGAYYLLSGGWLVLALVPWCACMGATIPVAMFAIRRNPQYESRRSFSFLYLANVIGAVGGALASPALIELFGFHGTLRIGAVLNWLIFIVACTVSIALRERSAAARAPVLSVNPVPPARSGNTALLLLFATGLTTMAMEVVWIRLFTFFVGPLVYSFAKILATYLAATFAGSMVYRYWSRRASQIESQLLWVSLALLGLLSLLTADGRFHLDDNLRVGIGIAPFAGVVGFLTPMLVDRWSNGDPDRAGRAYAVNIVGCILGPLLAGFVLLPWLGERGSMLVLVMPWFGMAIAGARRLQRGWQMTATAAMLIASLTVFFFTKDYEIFFDDGVTLRDSSATVIASGDGLDKDLIVNGVGMTSLTPITKMMAHFTLAHLPQPPRNVLIICFGMGTTFRSAMSWDIPVTVVELVPSVPKLFTYYHSDGAPLLASPRAHIVIDDGRRFLDRSPDKFDAIIIDPPPPIDAAGSSLLYSRDFYLLAKQHLSPGGILQQWLYEGDNADKSAATRALMEVFPYVRVFGPIDDTPGVHFLASMQPLSRRTAQQLLARMPIATVSDMMEWGPAKTPQQEFDLMLSREISPQSLVALSPSTPALQDERPINEYDRLRTSFPNQRWAAP